MTDVEAIRAAHSAGETSASIAKRLGLSYNTVWRIVRSGRFTTPTADGHISDRLPRNASTYTNYRCRCADCRADAARDERERRPNRSPEARRRANARSAARFNRVNAKVVAVAHRRGQPWTFGEIVIACDPGLTCREAALKIGRSMDTVKTMRRRRA